AWSAQVERRRREDEAAKAAPATPAVVLADCIRETELGNARRLVRHFGKDLRHCHPWKEDLVWDGRRWQEGNTAQGDRRAKEIPRLLYEEAAAATDDAARMKLVRHGLESEQAKVIKAAVALARSEPGVPVLPGQLDADPWLFNVLNGVIDLRTGDLR